MNWVTLGLAAGTMTSMAVVMSYILGWANKAFHVPVDPRVEAANVALPGANCGGCGYVGCNEYAEAVVAGTAAVNLCNVGGESCAAALADIMGIQVEQSWPYRPIIHCAAHYGDRLQRNDYRGEHSCTAANLVANIQGCTYGCLGFGDCSRACDYDALHIVDGLSVVDYEKCVGCKACAATCPRNIITMTPFKSERMLAVVCSNKDSIKEAKTVCNVGCLGCKACEKACSLFSVQDNLSTLNYEEYCADHMEDLIKASEKCPRKGGLIFVGKPTEKDIKAVADERVPEIVEPDFKTTVDDTEWRG